MDYCGFGDCEPMRLLPKLIDNPHSKPPPARLTSNGMTLPPSTNAADKEADQPMIVLKRDCNVDVDPKHISNRHEWATAHYHSFYNPHCLFELEIRWLVATSCILGDLITQWSQRTGTILGTNQVAFHLVPIPVDPFAEFDALRGRRSSPVTALPTLAPRSFQVPSTSKSTRRASPINSRIFLKTNRCFESTSSRNSS